MFEEAILSKGRTRGILRERGEEFERTPEPEHKDSKDKSFGGRMERAFMKSRPDDREEEPLFAYDIYGY